MRLASIKLAGFKSFVDPTVVPLPSNLIAVVGPNGCGKSNIIDAVRWVMGESSAKFLRGESMADVIFNGSTGRKPVGQAAIELLFDNALGKLPGSFAQFAEISVRREVNRDGQSTYYLNGTRCRRRDITDIFLGTGLGPRSYAIIEQGMISRVIDAKPDDLRGYIEEAAGISKYKERRRETETRINQTQENLARLNDIRGELERQIGHLSRQAKTAERYQTLRAEERLLQAQLLAMRYQSQHQIWQAKKQAISQGELQLEALDATLQQIDTQWVAARETQYQKNETVNQSQAHYYQLGNDITRLEQELAHFDKEYREKSTALISIQQSLAQALQEEQTNAETIAALQTELIPLLAALNASKSQFSIAEQTLQKTEDLVKTAQQTWDILQARHQKAQQNAHNTQSKLQLLEQRLHQAEQRAQRLVGEQQILQFDELNEEIVYLEASLAEQADIRTQIIHEQSAGQTEIAAIKTNMAETRRAQDALKTETRQIQGKISSLEVLQQAALGKQDKPIMNWLKTAQLDASPRLAEKITVIPGWERAVEVVLGFFMEAVCVPTVTAVTPFLATLTEGSVAFMAASTVNETATIKAQDGTLLQKIHSTHLMPSHLASIFTAEDLTSALLQLPQLATHESIVTKDGIWLSAQWLRIAHQAASDQGVLARAAALQQAEQEAETLTERATLLDTRLDEQAEELATAEQCVLQIQERLTEINTRATEIRTKLPLKQDQKKRLQQRANQIQAELTEINQSQQRDQETLRSERHSWQEAMLQLEELVAEKEALIPARDQYQQELDMARRHTQTIRTAIHEQQLQEQALQSRLQNNLQNRDRMTKQIAQLQQKETELKLWLAHDESAIVWREQLEEALQQRLQAEELLNHAKASLAAVQEELKNLEQNRNQLQTQQTKTRATLESDRLIAQEADVRCTTLQEQLTNESFVVAEVLQTLSETADETNMQMLLAQLGEQITKLGAINLAAIEEYQTQNERKIYLDQQNDDLLQAIATLEEAIQKIDRETREKFKATFLQVNEEFQRLFPILFGGGHAYLELTGDDLLDTGVTLMARPPGKRNSTIHLLSGGEKALTAVALVFSIFRLNPAPFCLLDEVDAPLDEANIGRFCKLLKEMSDKVQFVIISHSKVTMETADHLVGVTMHEPGVSRLVAVDVAAAIAMAE